MKIKNLFFALLVIAGSVAHADYIPGRIRVDAIATMIVSEATGKFRDVREVNLSELMADGKGAAGFAATFDRQNFVFDAIAPISEMNKCARISSAFVKTATNGKETMTIKLYDYSQTSCTNIRIKGIWTAEISAKNLATGEVSTMSLYGNPEFLAVTQ